MLNNKLMVLLGVVCLLIITAVGCATHSSTPAIDTADIHFLITGVDNRPLQGAKVASNSQPDGQLKLTGLTGSDGAVVFQNSQPGDYEFYVSRFDYYQTQIAITVTAGQTNSIPIQMVTSITPSTTPASASFQLTFAQLTSEPAKYNNQTITLEGFWFDGFEIEVLAERLEPASFAPGNVQPAGTKIWARNGLPEDVSKQLYLQPDNPTGYPAHYGKVELTGILEYGGQYGHMNAYQYQLTVQSAKLIPWSP